jgi:2-polyprenyl-6-methoxyphenol hydroxylase-like FAD-dependent oxidoreductase
VGGFQGLVHDTGQVVADRVQVDGVYGIGCRSVTQDNGQVTATFGEGPPTQGDLLIGADGQHSAVRRCLWGDGAVQPATFGTWQGLSPIDIDLTR